MNKNRKVVLDIAVSDDGFITKEDQDKLVIHGRTTGERIRICLFKETEVESKLELVNSKAFESG